MKKHFQNNLLILICLIITVHFVISVITTQYIARQVGSEMGGVVSESITKAMRGDEAANGIYKDMKKDADHIISKWNSPYFILSLPIGPLTEFIWKDIDYNLVRKPLSSGQITRNQFLMRREIIYYLHLATNSIAFGLVLFLFFKLYQLVRKETYP